MIGGRDGELEEARFAALATTGLLDTAPDRDFDLLVDLARRAFGTQHVAVSLIDRKRQFFAASRGIPVRETPLSQSFCARAVAGDEPLIIADARADERFVSHPAVTGGLRLRSYAGVPIRVRPDPDSPTIAIGTFCLSGDEPREMGREELDLLARFAQLAEALIQPRFVAAHAAELVVQHQADVSRLTRAYRQFRQAERMADMGSWQLTLADSRLEWSEQVFVIHGLPVGTPPGLDQALDFYPVQSRAVIAAAVERAIGETGSFDVEADLLTARGELKRVRAIGEVETADGVAVALIGVFQDITARYAMEQTLRLSATTDELTRLPNRAGFNDALDRRMAQARATGEPLALALIDLDGFKLVNDRCGHLAGDEVLKAIAGNLSQPHWADCMPARLGGDDFVLILAMEPASASFQVALDALLADLRHEVAAASGPLLVSGTVGVSWMEPGCTRRDLLDRADRALYRAKRARPETACVHSAGEDDGIRIAA